MRKKLMLLLLTMFASLGLVASATVPAQSIPLPDNHNRYGAQTYGGNVYNAYWSESSLKITDDRPAWSYQVLNRDMRSCTGGYTCNVQGFRVESGYRMINSKTGYVYVGGEWHYMCCNNTFLSLVVDWLGNPPPHALGDVMFNAEVLQAKGRNVESGTLVAAGLHRDSNTWTWGG